MSGQSIMDRVTAAKHSIAGQGLAKTVCKATTEEVMGPKRKHLDYLLQCTNEPNVSIPQLADLLIERTQNQSWVIVFKSLVTIHNLMNYGNERFTQYLASNNCSFQLSNFIDKTGVQGYDMSTFIRRYAKYLNEKAYTYRTMAFDFCKVKRGRDDGLLRTMNADKLLKTLPVLQKQIDGLLEFDCSANELTNGVINACFMLLFKDLIRLFACYNDGTINLLEKYFDMNKKNCKEALDIYKKFLVRMDKVAEFLKVAENVGIDKGDIPDLAKGLKIKEGSAPASLLDALEQHLQSMEGKKGGTTVAPPPKPSGFNSAVNAIASNSSIQISEDEKKKILEDESKQLQQLKESHTEPPVTIDLLSDEPQDQKVVQQPQSSPSQPAQASNPFGDQPAAPAPAQTGSPIKASDDLLNLTGNPFVENVQNVMQMQSATNAFGAPPPAQGWGAPPMAFPHSGGGFGGDTSNFANFPNGTGGGSTLASLDVSTSLSGAMPLTPSPTNVPSEPTVSFDPYESLMGLSEGEGVSATGSSLGGGLFEAPIGATVEPTQEAAGLSPGVTDAGVGGLSLSGRGSPCVEALSADAFSANTFSSDVFPTSDAFSSKSDTDLSGFDAFGEVLKPQGTPTKQGDGGSQEKLANKDLDSSLAMLASNIGINGAESVKKPQHQWQPKGDQKKTGGQHWAPTGMAQATTWSQPSFQQPAPRPVMGGYGQPAMPMQQPAGMMAPGMAPMGGAPMMMGGMAPAPAGGMPMTNMHPGQMGMAPPMYGGMQPGMQPMAGMNQPRPQTTSQPNDPFGAL